MGVKGARGGDDGSYKREGDEEVVSLGRTVNKCRKIRKHVTETSFEVHFEVSFRLLSPKLKTGYRYENQFLNPGFTNGFTQFCRYR